MDACPDMFAPAETDDLDTLARRYLALVAHKHDLGAVEQDLVDALHALAGGKKEWQVDGRTVATTFRPVAPKVDGDGLFRRVVAVGRDERRVDVETGEALESEGEAVARTIASVYPVTNSSVKPRSTALRERGIDLGEYQEVGGWARTVRVM